MTQSRKEDGTYDIAVIGGGINGCGIARDAAGRGLSVFLCEQGDLAGATSSASTKLIHGGLRYLEYYAFRLVREALVEREVLLRLAPHIVRPLRFVLPHHSGLRPAWLIRLGLFIYDHLGGRRILPGTRVLELSGGPFGAPLKPGLRKGFEYSDCWVDDARLVVLNAIDAAERGAEIRVRTRCRTAARVDGLWQLDMEDEGTDRRFRIRARTLVNATGPWVSSFLEEELRLAAKGQVRLVKGSHIIVPKLFDHDRAYIFQESDGRVVFAIPFEADFTLIGTTEVDFRGDPGAAAIDSVEVDYLCAAANEYFTKTIAPADVVYSYSGVRPLYDDGTREAKAATRDYVLELDGSRTEAAVLNIFGGKITTYRRLAEAALRRLRPFLPRMGNAWTAGTPLPGGDFPIGGDAEIAAELARTCSGLPEPVARRLARAYGTRAAGVLGRATSVEGLGRHFGAGLYEAEVRYQMQREWARTAEDVIWRRTKQGLRLSRAEVARLDEWMRDRHASVADQALQS